ncbi:hypothetical protein ACFQ61_10140 [Streptomyces sp. NPDC056500]|uniref:hypothetical protein n=1 Tax=Streptomyces sp. NPDC056500 TaxID=3345840 RepID=UPI0036807655
MHTAAPATGAIFGGLGAGGLALALAVLLVLGVQGKGRVKLKDNPAMICAFIAGTSFAAAGQIWTHPERIVTQGLTGLGVGTGTGTFGDVKIGAIALILLILMLCAPMAPKFGAALGLIAAVVWPATGTGTIWAAPVELAAAALMMVGG